MAIIEHLEPFEHFEHQKNPTTAKTAIFPRFVLYYSPPGGQNPIKTYRAPASMPKLPLLQVLLQVLLFCTLLDHFEMSNPKIGQNRHFLTFRVPLLVPKTQ